jgi:hypothetical protein
MPQIKAFSLALAAAALLTPAASAQLAGYEIVAQESAYDATVSKQLIVNCPKDKKVTGGGWAALDKTDAILEGQATTSQPAYDGSHWMVNAKNQSSFSPKWKLKVWAICAKAD